MRLVKSCFACAFFLVQAFCDENERVGIAVTPFATLSYPMHYAKKNYTYAWGGGAKLGLNYSSPQLLGYDFGVFCGVDQYRYNQNDFAKMTNICLDYSANLLFVTIGSSVGAARFMINKNTYDSLDGSTGTELKKENNQWQFSSSLDLGLRIPIGKVCAIGTEYSLVSTERAYMFWHALLSGAIKQVTLQPFSNAAAKRLENNDLAGAVIFKIINLGIVGCWYWFDYKHHNWPWHDDPPLRSSRITFSTTFIIPILK